MEQKRVDALSEPFSPLHLLQFSSLGPKSIVIRGLTRTGCAANSSSLNHLHRLKMIHAPLYKSKQPLMTLRCWLGLAGFLWKIKFWIWCPSHFRYPWGVPWGTSQLSQIWHLRNLAHTNHWPSVKSWQCSIVIERSTCNSKILLIFLFRSRKYNDNKKESLPFWIKAEKMNPCSFLLPKKATKSFQTDSIRWLKVLPRTELARSAGIFVCVHEVERAL